jgi:hypothetical protein
LSPCSAARPTMDLMVQPAGPDRHSVRNICGSTRVRGKSSASGEACSESGIEVLRALAIKQRLALPAQLLLRSSTYKHQFIAHNAAQLRQRKDNRTTNQTI